MYSTSKIVLLLASAFFGTTIAQPHGYGQQHNSVREANALPYTILPHTTPTTQQHSTVTPVTQQHSTVTPVTHQHPTQNPKPTSHKTTHTSPAPQPTSYPSPPSSGFGIAYSPYNSDRSCKSQSEVNADFAALTDYSLVRIYGTDCNQTATVLSAARAKNIKVFAGVYDIPQVVSEVSQIISAAAPYHFAGIDTVSIGNEGVNDGTYTVAEVVAAVATARQMLRAAGFTGSVVTVDTWVAVLANPELCLASDYAAVNCHAFFDGGQTAAQAGEWTLSQAGKVQAACGGKRTVITEAGWPWEGQTNGAAVPSLQNQQIAIASLRSEFAAAGRESGLVLFSAFDDLWKQNTVETFAAEQFWGIVSHAT